MGLACIVILSFSLGLGALDPKTPVMGYQLDEWPLTDRLPGQSVTNISQTSDGFLWLDSSMGLVRFDGQEFIPFSQLDLSDDPLGSKDLLQSIMMEEDGTLWVKKNLRGVLLYRNGQLEPLKLKGGFTGNLWLGVKDSYGNVWLGTDFGNLVCYSGGKLIEYGPKQGIPGRGISCIIEDRGGRVWVSTNNGGVFVLKSGRFHPVEIPGVEKNTTVFNWLLEDRSGTIWIGTNKGLWYKKDGKFEHITTASGLAHNDIVDMIQDGGGNLWVGTKNGLSRIQVDSADSKDGLRIDSCLKGKIINVILEDREKNLWIGTEGEGLKRLRDPVFQMINFGENNSNCITCVHHTANGEIWAGNLQGEVMRLENKTVVERIQLNSDVLSMADDREGNLWVGTQNLGLFHITPERKIVHFEDRIPDRFIPSLFCDSRGRVWLGHLGGFTVYQKGEFTAYRKRKPWPCNVVFFFREDKAGNIWIGTFGLYMLEKGELNPDRLVNVLGKVAEECGVSSMFRDEDGTLWATNYCGTIFRKRGKEIKVFEDGKHWRNLVNTYFHHTFKDSEGLFWINTQDGILRLDPRKLADPVGKRLPGLIPREYGLSDGLNSRECSSYSFHSAISPGNGEYWFCTKKGMAVLNLDNVKINKIPPPVFIEKVKADGRESVVAQPEYTFDGVGHLCFSFTAPIMASQEGVCFKYRLEGYEKEWSMVLPGGERTAEYWNLPAGRYRFAVTACNSDGVWNRRGAQLGFVVPAAFWDSTLAKVLIFLVIFLVAGYFYFRHRGKVKK